MHQVALQYTQSVMIAGSDHAAATLLLQLLLRCCVLPSHRACVA
jgi:hypothetical protein